MSSRMEALFKLACVVMAVAAPPAAAQQAEEVAVARRALAAAQELSFAKRREYCGFIGYDAAARLVATPPTAGTTATCAAPYPEDLAVVASWHTHGAFDRGYVNELPSDIDVEGDRNALLNGYVATPGGRLWYVDGRAATAHLICGPGCLPVAPGFYKGADGIIRDRYTLEELREAFAD